MLERDLVSEFNVIVEQHKISPFGFRLRKTGSILKLTEYNGLYYIDLINLYKVINELLGPNISEEIIEYLSKITFSEMITLETANGTETKSMTCIQFIDSVFFNKCSNWITQKSEQVNDEYNMLFGTLFTSSDPFSTLNDKTRASHCPRINEMLPFKGFTIDKSNNSSSSCASGEDGYFKNNSLTRPRGKQMNMAEESLNDRPFVCEIPFCDRACKRYEHLKRHMKMHTGDKPFKCSFPNCNKTFSRSDNLQQHKKTHGSYFNSSKQIRFKNETQNFSKYDMRD